jgi:phenylacetic acid degradation operon negative regulatory protein
MRKKKIINLILKLSDGLFSSLIDLILWNIFFLTEVSLVGSPGKIKKAELLAQRDFQHFNSEVIKRAIVRARSRGFIKGDFTLTKEGRERLKNLFPKYFGKKKWDGNWYLVIYDIPETKKRLREILRENLKRLGFGQLQASVWISPFNFLGEVEEIIKNYNLSSYVILAISDKVGREEAKILARRIWNLDKINELYKSFLSKFKRSKSEKLYFEYLNILKKDPQLPNELLPRDWKGDEVHKLFSKFNLA